MNRSHLVGGIAAVAGAVLLLSSCSSGGSGDTSSSAAAGASSTVKPASGEPYVLGMINQENSAAGSFPEVREASQAAVSYINDFLGGLGGRPLKIEPCVSDGSPASSANCARQLTGDGVVAVLGGVDFGTSGSMPVLEKAKVPYVGGVPLLPPESTSPISFQFSGGSAGAFSAQDQYIVKTLGAKKVSILTTANPAGLAAASIFGKDLLAKLGVTDVQVVQAANDAADFTAPVQQISSNDPDAILVLFSSPACSRIMQARAALGVTATTFYPGSCLTEAEVQAGGAGADGAYFNSDNQLITGDDPQVVIYRDQMKKYAPKTALSSFSQTGFQSVMNLYAAMQKAGGTPTAATVISTLKSAVDVPSFMGHPYTCDGKQIAGSPAICGGSQRIVQYQGGKFNDVGKDWVNGTSLVG